MLACKFLALSLLLVAHERVYGDSAAEDDFDYSELPDELRYGSLGEPISEEDYDNAEQLPNLPDVPHAWEVMENPDLFEGDIVLPENLRRQMKNTHSEAEDQRNAIVNMYKKWPGGVVPYVISAAFNTQERSVIARAFIEYHRRTCIKFQPRSDEADYIHIQKGNGCSSHVGRTRGGQPVTLGQGCVHFGTVLHEFMHAVGFWHEQSRWDRDDYVTIHYNNIMPNMAFNFNKYRWGEIQNLSISYDIASVMHYPKYAFAKDYRYPTITPKNPNAHLQAMGQRDGFSEKDVRKINILYRCAAGMAVDESTELAHESAPTEVPIDPESGAQACDDMDQYCEYWAHHGECKKNPHYMLANCAKSCKVCGAKAEMTNML